MKTARQPDIESPCYQVEHQPSDERRDDCSPVPKVGGPVEYTEGGLSNNGGYKEREEALKNESFTCGDNERVKDNQIQRPRQL